MRTIWCFGDSFTEGFSKTNPYSIYKGYQPLTHPQIIGERLGIDWINLGKGGASNYDILETISQNASKIKSDDIISIGWSNTHRFRMADNHLGRWQSIVPEYLKSHPIPNKFLNNEVSTDTLDEIIFNRDSKLYKEEVRNWINLLKHTFRDNTMVNWTWCQRDWKFLMNYNLLKYDEIRHETNGVINDGHWSETGQHQFSDWFIKTIETTKHTSVLTDIIYI